MTYAHNSGIRRRIYGKSALFIPYSPLMDCYFYTFANGDFEISVSGSEGSPLPTLPDIKIRISGYIAIL